MSSNPRFFDRVLETSTTTGSGTYTLAGSVTGYQPFSVVGNGNSCYYCAADVDLNGVPSGGWEVGIGTYLASGTTLSRDSIEASSNSGSAVSWAPGTRRVVLVASATYFSTAGNVVGPASATDSYVATFDGTTGKLLKNGGAALSNIPTLSGSNTFAGANTFATNALELLVGQLKFPTVQNPSSNANTLDDYEEGTWTPVDGSGASLSITVDSATYVKIGKTVFVTLYISYPTTTNGAGAMVGGLPFANSGAYAGLAVGYAGILGVSSLWLVLTNATSIFPITVEGVQFTNAQLSNQAFALSGSYQATA